MNTKDNMSHSKLIKRLLIMLIIIGLLFGAIFGYKIISGMLTGRAMAKNIPTITVSATKIDYTSWQPEIKVIGSLRAIRGVSVTAELAGMVQKIYFKPGDNINDSTPLVQLNIDSDLARLKALEATAELAKITYTRDKAQYEIKAISKAALDVDLANLKSSEAQVAEQAAIIAKKTVTAPFTGRLGISAVNPGQYVNPGDKIVTLQQLDPIYVDFYVPQQELKKLTNGQQVQIVVDTFPDKIFKGSITTIDPLVDTATRNVAVEATISNDALLLLPGMFATVTITIGKPKNYLTLPQAAISYNAYGDIVYLVKQQGSDKQDKPIFKVTQNFVTVGETRGDQIAVLSGLKAGDEVVTAGQLKLKNGSIVNINNAVEPQNNPNPKVKNEK